MFFVDISVTYQPIFMKLVKIIFQQNPNIAENFVKLYSVYQKLDHLTCSKLKLWRPYFKSIKLIQEFYYMSNGLTFAILTLTLLWATIKI